MPKHTPKERAKNKSKAKPVRNNTAMSKGRRVTAPRTLRKKT